MRYAMEHMKNPHFMTITLHPDFLPVGSSLESKIDAISGNLWKSFRKNYLKDVTCWFRVWEFGSHGDQRPHIHLVVDLPENSRFPIVTTAKNESMAKFLTRIASDPKAQAFYSMLRRNGMGKFDCEPIRSPAYQASYLSGYLTKPLPPVFESDSLRGFRVYGFSRSCAKKPELPKRHCYKLAGIRDEKASDGLSEIPCETFAQISAFDINAVLAMDYKFQMQDAVENNDFDKTVLLLFDKQKTMQAAYAKTIRQFTRDWVKLGAKLKFVLHEMDGDYSVVASRVVSWCNSNSLYASGHYETIWSYVNTWVDYHLTLLTIRHNFRCSATIRFLREIILDSLVPA